MAKQCTNVPPDDVSSEARRWLEQPAEDLMAATNDDHGLGGGQLIASLPATLPALTAIRIQMAVYGLPKTAIRLRIAVQTRPQTAIRIRMALGEGLF